MSAVVVSGLASSEHEGGGASFDDAPSSSSSSTADQAIDSPGLNTLTREEAFELGRFSDGKARIDEHLELLQSKPSIDAFADFKPSWESMTLSDIEGLWEVLDAHKTQVSEWIDERDGIEETTLKFDAADMERLRKLAKACSQRNMSREDTDIVEVALETLVALEGLRVALSSRERRLSLLDARLAWETARRECCALYRPLADDVDAFVAQQARWTTPSQRQQPASTYSDLTSHSEGLLNRIAFFSNVVVSQSSAALDEVIEQCQAPEAFLDEQDRLEDLAVALTSRAGFVQDLLSQWKAAEDLQNHVQALSTGSQSLLALVADVKSGRPTRDDAAAIASNSIALRRDLIDLCQHDQAEKFLGGLERPAARLQFCTVKHPLPLPRHDDHWPEQAQIDDDILAALRAQLAEAATAARQAIEAAKAFAAALDALEKASKLQSKVQESTKRCQEIAATARSGWMADDEGLDWDTIVKELLRPTRPPHQGLKKAETIPALQSSFRGVEKETQAWCNDMLELHLTCQSLGLTPAAFQPEADNITAAWHEASQAAKSALDDAMSLREALRLLDDLFRAQDTAGPALEQLRTCLLADIDALAVSADNMADKIDANSVPRNSDRDADMTAIEAKVSGHSAAFEVVQRDALLAKAPETLSALTTLITDGRNNLEDCQALRRWSQALYSQRMSVSEQHSRFAQLDGAGFELRHAFSSNTEDQQLDFDALEERLATFAKDVDNFKESQHTSLKLLGNPPTLHTPSTPPLDSPDALVRDASHSWCLKLDGLRDEVRQLLADARERARALKEQEEREAAERGRLRLEEEEKQAAEERERLRLEEEERQAAIERERQAMLEAEAKAKAQAEAEAAAKAQAEAEAKAAEEAAKEGQAAQERAQAEAERVAKEEEERARAKAEAEAEEARARAEREAREEEERRRAAEEKARLRAAEEEEARRQAAEEEARLEAAEEEAQAKIDEEELAARVAAAPEQVYEVLEQVRQEAESCDSAVASRDRGFKKVLGSANSRRLPQRAFISELCNRRKAAEDTLTARRDALDATMQSMTELLALLPSTPEYDDVRREAERAQRKVHADSHALLEAFDDAIRAEGGDPLASYSNPGSVESSPIGTSSAPRRRLDSLKGGIRSPPVSPVSPASPAFPAQPLPDDVRQLIEELKRSLQPGEVELQTILDGKKQARMLIELPTLADAERVDGEANDIRQKVDELLASYPKEAILGLLADLVQARVARVERYKQLAAFNKDFIAMERALGDFLNLLDEVDGSRLDRLTPSPHPGSRPSSRLTRTPVQDVTQTLQTRLAALDPLIEAAEKAAKPVAQDVRVRDRLEQLRKSYVDMAEMARDVLNPEAQRSLSAMSHATSDGSLSTASTPLPGTPRFGQYLDDDDDSSSVMATPTKIPRPRASAIEGRAGERPRTASLTMRSSTTDSRLPRLRPPSTPLRHGPPDGRHSSAGPATPVSRSLGPRRGLPSIAQSPVSTPPRPTGASRTVDSTPTSRPRTTSMKQPAPPLLSSVSRTSRPSTSTPSSSRPRASTSAATVPRFGSDLNSSGTPSSTRPNRYRANPKSRLDIAVAKVINRMPMPVSMVHASQMPRGRGSGNGGSRSVSSSTDSTTSVRREEWKDDSGRYWVGHPDPKLCFCRILRSRTIMVRIGGGWQELTRYLIQHYGLSVPLSVAAVGGDASVDGSTDAEAATNSGLASSSSIRRFAGEAGSGNSSLPWLSSATLRDKHTRIPSTSSTTSIASSIARGNRRTASTASSVGTAAARSGGISSPILFNADGSPQDYFGMSPRTPTGAGSRQAARQRTTSLQGQGGSPTSRAAAGGGRASPTPPPPVPPLPLVLDVSPATQRRRDGASTSPLTAFTVQQREGRESAGRASAHAFQLKAPPTPAPAPTPRGGVGGGTTSPPPPSSWRSPKHASSAIRSPPMAKRMGLPADSSPSKPGGGGGDGLPASESGSDLLPLFFRKQEPSSPEDHRRAGAATPSSGRKSAAAVRTRKVSGPAGGRSGTAGGSGAKSPT